MKHNKFSRFWEIFGSDLGSAEKIALSFTSILESTLKATSSNIENANAEAILFELHKIKGTLNYLGFSDEVDSIEALEGNVVEPFCWAKIGSSFLALKQELNLLEKTIHQEVYSQSKNFQL